MQLYAVVVPPPGVVQDALTAAGDLFPPPPPPPDAPKPGLLDRLRGRRPAEPEAVPVARLSALAPDAVFVHLAKLGNVTADDAAGLAEALAAEAAAWRAPELHVSRVLVAEAAPYDVRAQLEGDVEALRDIYRNVNEVARVQRFFLDRRSFRSELTLGSAEVEGDAPVPESIAGSEVLHRGPRWSPSHVTLLRTSFSNQATAFVEVARIGLADAAGDLGARTGAGGSAS